MRWLDLSGYHRWSRVTCVAVLLTALIAFFPITVRSAVPSAGRLLEKARNAFSNRDYKDATQFADSVLSFSANRVTRMEALDLKIKSDRALGNLGACERGYKELLSLFEDGDNREHSIALFNYAQFLLSAGRPAECMTILKATNFAPGTEESLRKAGLMASACHISGDSSRAVEILNQAIEMGQQSPTLPVLLQNRGFILRDIGRPEDAYTDLARSAELTIGIDHGVALSNASLSLSMLRRHEDALSLIDKALDVIREEVGETHPDYIIALRKKGEILMEGGFRKEARSVMGDFFDREMAHLSGLLPDMTPQLRLDYWTKEKPLLSKCFILGDEDPEFLFKVAMARRNTSLLASPLYRERGTVLVEPSAVRGKLSEDEAIVAFVTFPDMSGSIRYAAIVLPARGKARYVDLFGEEIYTQRLRGGMTLYEAVTGEDPDAKNSLYTDQGLAEKIWRPVLDALPHGTNNIDFLPEGILHLWGIENMPFEGRERYSLVRRFSVDETGNEPESQKGKTLVAGGLDYDAVDTSDENSARENITTEILSGGRGSIAADRQAYEELQRALDPGYTGRIFGYLSGSDREAARVSKLIMNSDRYSTFTEEDFKSEGGKYRNLHLATHAYALDCGLQGTASHNLDSVGVDLTLYRSGLALTGANVMGGRATGEDGILSAREICEIDLSGVDLAVLSACQTAKGVITDESASGMIRALKIAGVGSIVATLWEVDDEATSLFMENFYTNLASGMTRQLAFDTARRSLADLTIHRKGRRFSAAALAGRDSDENVEVKPYFAPWYWAPFILIDP